MAKRIQTEYIGVYYTLISVHGGKRTSPGEGKKKKEKCFLVTFKRPGERKQREETIGRASQGWTAAKANNRRSDFINGELTKKEEAEEALRQQRETELEKQRNKHLYLTVDQAMAAYMEHLDSVSKQQDQSRYNLYIKPICGDKPVSKLEPMDLLEISKPIKEKGLKSQTEKHVLALLRRAIYWAKSKNLCAIPDNLKFDMPKFNNEVNHEHYDEEELAVLIAKLEDMEYKCPVGSGFLQCGIYTGMRPKQIRHLRWPDIDPQRDTITVRKKGTEKDGKAVIPLNEHAKKLFERMPKTDIYVFPSSRGGMLGDYRYQIKKALDNLEIPENFRPMYSLRHNFASWFASLEGTDIYMLRDLLTHSDIRTTQRYAHLFEKNKKKDSNRISATLKSFETKHRETTQGKETVGRIKVKPQEDVSQEEPKSRFSGKKKKENQP